MTLTNSTKATKVITALGTLATEIACDTEYGEGRKTVIKVLTEAMGLPQESLVRLYDILQK